MLELIYGNEKRDIVKAYFLIDNKYYKKDQVI